MCARVETRVLLPCKIFRVRACLLLVFAFVYLHVRACGAELLLVLVLYLEAIFLPLYHVVFFEQFACLQALTVRLLSSLYAHAHCCECLLL